MPHVEDPATGFVATANNKPARDGESPYLGTDWLDGYRAGRIVEAPASRTDWDLAASQRLQLDPRSIAWREVREAVLAVTPTSEASRLGHDLLAAWDGIVGASSSAATVYELFAAEMTARIAAARAPRSGEWARGKGFATLVPLTTFVRGSQRNRLLREQP